MISNIVVISDFIFNAPFRVFYFIFVYIFKAAKCGRVTLITAFVGIGSIFGNFTV